MKFNANGERIHDIYDTVDECQAENKALRAENARLTQELEAARAVVSQIIAGRVRPAFCTHCNSVQLIKEHNCGDWGPCYACVNCGVDHKGWALKPESETKLTELLEEDDIPF